MNDLYPVQLAALHAAQKHLGFAYFMEMGLGKTRTILVEYGANDLHSLVVLCPNSFKTGWQQEADKIGIARNFIHVFESKHRLALDQYLDQMGSARKCVIFNYESLLSSSTRAVIIERLSGPGSMLVADESIRLKNNQSLTTKYALGLAKHFPVRRILSGKPVTQGPQDLWGQLRFIGLLEGFNFYAFRNRFCRMGGFEGKQVIGAQNESELAEIMEPHVFKARKGRDLPDKIYTTREIARDHIVYPLYAKMQKEFMLRVAEDNTVTTDMILTKLMKMQQIQSGFIIDEAGVPHQLVEPKHNPKLKLLLELLDDEIVGKVIVGCHFRYSVTMLRIALAKYFPMYIAGGMEPGEIESAKFTFNEDPLCRILIGQLEATKYGHTLIGGPGDDRCATTFFFENTFSLDTRSQFEDRNHRHGQDKPVVYIDPVMTPLDRKILDVLQRKENVAASILQYGRETGILP